MAGSMTFGSVSLLHNRSARVEALPQLSVCLSLGITVVSFDFSGSGLSEGQHQHFVLSDDLQLCSSSLQVSMSLLEHGSDSTSGQLLSIFEKRVIFAAC